MAKEQSLPLNPAKISGVCNRLLCCLTYEYSTYHQQRKGRGHEHTEGERDRHRCDELRLAAAVEHDRREPSEGRERGQHDRAKTHLPRPHGGIEHAEPLRAPELGSIEQLRELATKHRVHRIVVTLSERRGRLPTIALLNCRLAGIRIENGEEMYERITGKVAVERMRPSHLIFTEGFESSKLTHAVKRLLDVVLALVGLVVGCSQQAAGPSDSKRCR